MNSMKTTMMIFMAVILSMSVSGQIDGLISKGVTVSELQTVFTKADFLLSKNTITDVKLGSIKKDEKIGWKYDGPNADTTDYLYVKVTQFKCGYDITYSYSKMRKKVILEFMEITDESEKHVILITPEGTPKATFMSNIKSLIAKNN